MAPTAAASRQCGTMCSGRRSSTRLGSSCRAASSRSGCGASARVRAARRTCCSCLVRHPPLSLHLHPLRKGSTDLRRARRARRGQQLTDVRAHTDVHDGPARQHTEPRRAAPRGAQGRRRRRVVPHHEARRTGHVPRAGADCRLPDPGPERDGDPDALLRRVPAGAACGLRAVAGGECRRAARGRARRCVCGQEREGALFMGAHSAARALRCPSRRLASSPKGRTDASSPASGST